MEPVVKRVVGRPRTWPREVQIEAIRAFARKHRRIPETKDFGTEGLPYYTTVIREFGTLSNARAMAGLPRGISKYTIPVKPERK